MEAYYTHRKYLQIELDKLPDNSTILELGIGAGSSALMQDFCDKNPSSTVYAYESDISWIQKTKEEFGSPLNYSFTHIPSWSNLSELLPAVAVYDLVFVDQTPWQARLDSIDLLANSTKTFILHDYDYFNKGGWHEKTDDWLNSIYVNDDSSYLGPKYSNQFILEDNSELKPPTLVLRNKELSNIK
tara:strand:+ start:9170 stop:9727 length:558 start_codon:yes stop_codon:yes gene_type:complete